ncbi:MAG: ATP-binding protein [Gemmatimonadota bacterium]
MRRALSLRTKFVLVLTLSAVLPLGLVGLWLTRTAVRSGEVLLRHRLELALDGAVDEIGARWTGYRAELLDLAELPAIQEALRSGRVGRAGDLGDTPEVRAIRGRLEPHVARVTFRAAASGVSWTVSSAENRTAPLIAEPTLAVPLDVYDRLSGERLGTLEAELKLGSLVPGGGGVVGVAGAVLGLFQRPRGTPILPLAIDPVLLRQPRFTWEGASWITAGRSLSDPPLELALAAPLSPIAQPFERAARRGALALLVVALAAVALGAVLTRRLTGSLGDLAAAADAVARGGLGWRLNERAPDELGRVARAFNAMRDSLERTLRELSRRESLAAVGEFASSLAHEVRNPLSAINLDLQRLAERASDPGTAEALGQVLRTVARLNASVTGALRLARSGRVAREAVDLSVPLMAAIRSAESEFRARQAQLECPALRSASITVRGDAAALEQVFLNLLLNSAQALGPDGRAGVELATGERDVTVSLWDTGCGIPTDDLGRVREPFFTTRPEGTGLGMTIAQRIVEAHGGDLTIESEVGQGTTVRVRLPLAGRGPEDGP